MIKEFIEAWNENKGKLKKEIENNLSKISEFKYVDLLKLTLQTIDVKIDGWLELNIEEIKCIDFGDYQGTLIFVFRLNVYQPSASETFYTFVNYGSCSGCDTLLRIQNEYNREFGVFGVEPQNQSEEIRNEIVNDYLTLCLHMIQNTHTFKED